MSDKGVCRTAPATLGPPTALRLRHAQTVSDSSSNKIEYVKVINSFLNPEGHQNPIYGSKVTAILLKRWILSIAVWVKAE